MRDSKGRFKSEELSLPLPSTTMALNIMFLYIHSTTMALCRSKIQYFRKNKCVT